MGRLERTELNKKRSKIAELRKKRGWTQKYLAEVIGYSEIYIKKLEKAKVPNPGIDVFSKLAYALSTTVEELWRNYESMR